MRRPRLAPLEPNQFLAWAYAQEPIKIPGSQPLTIDDLWFQLSGECFGETKEQLRKRYVGIAARVRFNQRLGLDPWTGEVR